MTEPIHPVEAGDTWQVFPGPTPAGGVKSVWHYFRQDEDGRRHPVRPGEANLCEIHEVDADGKVIMTTIGYLAHGE